jgi:predicted nucleotidyltransferase
MPSRKENPLDILAFIEKGRGYKELLTDAVEIELYGYKVYVLSLQTLIELKRDSKDAMDRYRLPIFEETLRQSRENNKK